MNRLRGRAIAATALIAGVLMVSGCAPDGSTPDATPKQAEEKTTTDTVDSAIATIDPDLIDHVDLVMNTSVGCPGADGTPQATVCAWQNMRYVWLVSGAEPVAAADALIKTYEKQGWNPTPNQAEEPDSGRTVLLTKKGDTDKAAGLSVSARPNTSIPAVLYLSSTSACFDVAGVRDRPR
ncbi:hypothetical protein E3T26_02420 [Cryobacterium sp. TMT1-21]|uniref:hypothetical protein n=1 Tax=Cryobacterium sp. TMT1-21 TaxID=1259234 RepID=UPI00106B82EF|nr:hypothetical protein [Cryobacterium sp. TMT1-21]TFD17277.1 hypothetical protein E3T26_02420 [Cryobacterium sp. TMT1-21]